MLHVAVAVIEDPQRGVLLSRRHDHLHQGGLWEFPGGKVEPGEDVTEALRREIDEELGLQVIAQRPLIQVRHHYPDRSVLLDVQRVTDFSGTPRGMEGQALAWVKPEAVHEYPLPAADRPIISAIRLPSRYLVTGADPARPGAFLARLEQALKRGERLIQLRAPQLDPAQYLALARLCVACCHRYSARLLVNADAAVATACGADGVHLNSRRLMALQQRPPAAGGWLAASCHSVDELAHAEAIGVDFALLSPVLATRSHPQAAPLGWDRFAEMVRRVQIPVYALGGMRQVMVDQAWGAGGQGIAAIGALWPEG